jgi:uncharacterized protein YbdZ (MbtH family)
MNSHGDASEDKRRYRVVVNHEEQYSIWPEYKKNPLGWTDVGKSGSKSECLEYIKEVWTDMRPLSLRKRMEQLPKGAPASAPTEWYRGASVVDRLCEGEHPVEPGLRPEKTVRLLKEAIDRGYVHVKFKDTKGGTELGIRLKRDSCDFSRSDFEAQTGVAHVEGKAKLDYVMVRCIADIDLATLEGTGRLVRTGPQADIASEVA